MASFICIGSSTLRVRRVARGVAAAARFVGVLRAVAAAFGAVLRVAVDFVAADFPAPRMVRVVAVLRAVVVALAAVFVPRPVAAGLRPGVFAAPRVVFAAAALRAGTLVAAARVVFVAAFAGRPTGFFGADDFAVVVFRAPGPRVAVVRPPVLRVVRIASG